MTVMEIVGVIVIITIGVLVELGDLKRMFFGRDK
jgi:hypothetical protein